MSTIGELKVTDHTYGINAESIPLRGGRTLFATSSAEFSSGNITSGTTSIGDLIKMKIVDKNNKREIYYNVVGADSHDILVNPEWTNRNKELFLNISGSWMLDYKEDETDEDNKISTLTDKIYVSTEIYEKWDYEVKNGILKITLFEKINPQPDFPRIENK